MHVAKPDLLLYECLALQDYDNKAPDDKGVAIVSCLDIEACVMALLYLHIKLVW